MTESAWNRILRIDCFDSLGGRWLVETPGGRFFFFLRRRRRRSRTRPTPHVAAAVGSPRRHREKDTRTHTHTHTQRRGWKVVAEEEEEEEEEEELLPPPPDSRDRVRLEGTSVGVVLADAAVSSVSLSPSLSLTHSLSLSASVSFRVLSAAFVRSRFAAHVIAPAVGSGATISFDRSAPVSRWFCFVFVFVFVFTSSECFVRRARVVGVLRAPVRQMNQSRPLSFL